MKIAVLSDIHSNYIALEVCYDYISQQDIDGIIYLGDYVSDCPYPHKTMSLLYEKSRLYKSWFVRGNREEYFINHHDNHNDGWKYSSNSGSLLYTYENLTSEDIEFFRQCEKSFTIEIGNCSPLTICHGSPSSMRELLHSGSENTNNYLRALDTDYLLCGHTHRQFSYSYEGKVILNPGSVGIPVEGRTDSQFAILHWTGSKWQPEFLRMKYNIGKLLKEFEVSGIYDKAKMWSRAICKSLLTGEDYALFCLRLANKLASEKEASHNPCDIDERYWNEAGKQLGII